MNNNNTRFGALLGLSLLLASCGQSTNNTSKKVDSNAFTIASAQESAEFESDVIEGEYLVMLKPGAHLGGISAQSVGETQLTAQNLAAGLGLDPQGLEIQKVYNSALKGFAAKLTPQHLETLAHNSAVARVEKNFMVYTDAVQTTDPNTWGLDRIDQRENKLSGTYDPGATGKGVVAYIVDSGVRLSHNEFEGRAEWGTNTTGDSVNTDCNGHGTHVAGTVGGKTYGVAKDVTLVAVKVIACGKGGPLSNILDGLEWVRVNHFKGQYKDRPALINMSINSNGGTSRLYDEAIRAITSANITMVNSAGNANANACRYGPANNPEAIVVGATDRYNNRSDFSNWGSCVDLFAPGSDIASAAHDGDDRFSIKSGTSMAAPHVAGAAALILERHPTYTPAQVEERLIADSTKNVLQDIKEGSPNRLLFLDRAALSNGKPAPAPTVNPGPKPPMPAPTTEPTTNVALTRSYRGLMLHGRNAYLHARGKEFAGGTMVFESNGPAGTDFDLYLQKLGTKRWENVASSTNVGSKERIAYEGTKGTYRLVMRSTNGKGYIELRTNGW